MSDKPLDGRKIAMLVTDGFEHAEMTEPRNAPGQAGARPAVHAESFEPRRRQSE